MLRAAGVDPCTEVHGRRLDSQIAEWAIEYASEFARDCARVR